MKAAVFLDRDGVLNRAFVREGKSYPPDTLEDFSLLDGVVDSCAQLKKAGYLLIVVTNQPDVATGKQTRLVVEQMHKKLRDMLPLDDVFTCYHVDSDLCSCRKPAAGMLLNAANKYTINLAKSFMVGDRWRDIEAGKSAGCRALFIDYGYDEKRPTQYDAVVSNLVEACEYILTEVDFES